MKIKNGDGVGEHPAPDYVSYRLLCKEKAIKSAAAHWVRKESIKELCRLIMHLCPQVTYIGDNCFVALVRLADNTHKAQYGEFLVKRFKKTHDIMPYECVRFFPKKPKMGDPWKARPISPIKENGMLLWFISKTGVRAVYNVVGLMGWPSGAVNCGGR